MASLDMDSLKDGLAIALPIMVAAVVSSAIAFFVVPFYFQTRLTPFAFSLIFVSLGAAGAGFSEYSDPSNAFFKAALVIRVTIVDQCPGNAAKAFSIGIPTI